MIDLRQKKWFKVENLVLKKKIKQYSSFKIEFINELSKMNIICFRNNGENVKLSSQDQRDEFVSTYDRKFLQ